MMEVTKSERGYPTLFNEIDKLTKRARRTNLEAMDNYVNGTRLREALVNLIHNWDKVVYEYEVETCRNYPVKIGKTSSEVSGKGQEDSS
jgi:hypothetical protein